jgi:thiamine monophosphate synthase
MREILCDVAIIGAGTARLAAERAAREAGPDTIIVGATGMIAFPMHHPTVEEGLKQPLREVCDSIGVPTLALIMGPASHSKCNKQLITGHNPKHVGSTSNHSP